VVSTLSWRTLVFARIGWPSRVGVAFVEGSPGVHGWAAACLAGSFFVVEVHEAVDLGLEFDEVTRRGSSSEVVLECAVVALDLALGLGAVGLAVFEGDAERGEFDLEAGGCAAVRGGVDRAVVAEHAGRQAVAGRRVEEDAHDVRRGCGGDRDGGEHSSAVVVDDVDDLAADAGVEMPVGHVGLPALVGQCGFGALPARSGTLLGLGGDETSPAQDPMDRRACWGRDPLDVEVVAIVEAPASRPSSTRCLRNPTIASSTAGGV
jgi:hypothetical protein